MPTSRTISYDNLTTSTTQYLIKGLKDQIFLDNPLLALLNKNGGTYPGGESIRINLRTGRGDAGGFSRLSDASPIDKQIMEPAWFTPAKLYANVTVNQDESLDNSGPDAMISILEAQFDTARRTLEEMVEEQLFGDGVPTVAIPKPLNGLQNTVSTNPSTGIYGGRNRATNPEWRNQAVSGVNLAAFDYDQLVTDYSTACLSMKKEYRPDVILTDKDVYTKITKFATNAMQIAPANMVDLGFKDGIGYEGAAILWSPNCPAGHIYYLNTRFLKLLTHVNGAFKAGNFIESTGPIAKVQRIIYAAQFICDNPRMQLVRSGVT